MKTENVGEIRKKVHVRGTRLNYTNLKEKAERHSTDLSFGDMEVHKT